MKKVSILLIVVILFSVFLAGCKSSQPSTYNLTVTVKDGDGKPIEGAEVTLGDGDYVTDSKGVVLVKGLTETEVNVYISKEGYESIDEYVDLKADNKVSYILKKLEGAEPPKIDDSLLGFDTLNSYSYIMKIGISKTEIETEIQGFKEKPDKLRLLWTTIEGNETTEIISVGDKGKMKLPGMNEWIDMPGGDGDPFGQLLVGQGEFARNSFTDTTIYKVDKMGSETILGLPVIKYRITGKSKENKTDFYVWVVTSGDFKNLAVKSEDFSPGVKESTYISIELKSMNKPLNIKLP